MTAIVSPPPLPWKNQRWYEWNCYFDPGLGSSGVVSTSINASGVLMTRGDVGTPCTADSSVSGTPGTMTPASAVSGKLSASGYSISSSGHGWGASSSARGMTEDEDAGGGGGGAAAQTGVD